MTKKQKVKRALKDIGLLLLDRTLRGEIAPELAEFFGESKKVRDSDEVFKAQLRVGHDKWKKEQSENVTTQ